jgi:hypothetical protein
MSTTHSTRDPHSSKEVTHVPKEGDADYIYPTVRDEQIARSDAYLAEKMAAAVPEPPPPETTRRAVDPPETRRGR